MRLPLILALLAGCQSLVGGSSDDQATGDAHVQTLPGGPCTTGAITGTLPGVAIEISSASCVYHRGQPAVFEYAVTIDGAFPAIDVPETSSCDCTGRNENPASWVHWEINGTSDGGASQRYCYCDTGCCPPQAAKTISLAPATLDEEIAWSGHTWDGPSDTGNAEGTAFAVGGYGVEVSLYGFDHGEVRARLPIEIIP
jgi:hypothetical protein